MITLLQLFNYGDNYYENGGVFWEILANLIGIVFSFLIAYKILKIQLRYDKEKEIIKLEETYNSHYSLIKELINDTISTCEKQQKNIEKFIENAKKDPFKRNSLNFYLFPELRRFQKLENEMTFNSFMHKLKSYPDKNTIYKKIYNSIYFIEKSNELIEKCHSDLTHKSEFWVQKFKEINTEVSSLVHVYIGKLNLMNPIEQEIYNAVMVQQKIYLELLNETYPPH